MHPPTYSLNSCWNFKRAANLQRPLLCSITDGEWNEWINSGAFCVFLQIVIQRLLVAYICALYDDDDEPDIKLWITPTQLGFCSHPLSLWPFVTHFMLHLNSISAACVARANAPRCCKTAIAAGMCTHVILCSSGEMWPWLSVPLLRMWLAAFPPPWTPPPATITQTKLYGLHVWSELNTRPTVVAPLWPHKCFIL